MMQKVGSLIVAVWSLYLCTVSAKVTYITKTFQHKAGGRIDRVVVHNTTGKVYVGALNRLYQLSEKLVEEKVVNTGPRDDSPFCPPPSAECVCSRSGSSNCDNFVKKLTDSVDKALVIDYANGSLLVCFNLFQGHCQKRHLDDISLNDSTTSEVSIVPNDNQSSVVMFIAPGPDNTQVLYVAATRSTQGLDAYNDHIHSISSRNLSNLKFAYKSVKGPSSKKIDFQHRKSFRVHFIHGFSSGGFSYFLMVQKNAIEASDYGSRIARVCQNDKFYYSYTELVLQCTYGGTNYNILRAAYVSHAGVDLAKNLSLPHLEPLTDNDVLFAVFSKSKENSREPLADSVMCIYSLREIRKKFTETIQDCFRGIGNMGPAHYTVIEACRSSGIKVDDNFCGDDSNHPIAGTQPVEKKAVIHFPNSSVTALSVTTTYNYTVAFIGTAEGVLRKVVVEAADRAFEYENITIEEGSAINKDLQFDRSKTHAYVVSEKRISMVKVQDCGQYETCIDCVGAKDPYCGWCSLEHKCSLQTECDNADNPLRWLLYANYTCIRMLELNPRRIQIQQHEREQLVMIIQNLPHLDTGTYHCDFLYQDVHRTTDAVKIGTDQDSTNTTMQCKTPISNLLPAFPTGQDHIIMKLAIRKDNQDLVSENITFFDCTVHNSCTDCTKSPFPCTWCVQSHKCTSDTAKCPTDIMVTGQNVRGKSDTPGPESCPKINASAEILVASDSHYEVEVKSYNLHESFQNNFKCRFNLGGIKEVPAVKTGTDIIKCQTFFFNYSGKTESINVPFDIIWGDPPKELDNPGNTQVKVYKCSGMAENCGDCLVVDSRYGCGWCSDSCSIQSQCAGKSWLDNSKICTNPQVISFSPAIGPTEGGTRLTINGQSLGKTFDNIKNGVKVSGIQCEVVEEEYVPARSIVCETGRSSKNQSGLVEVEVGNTYTGRSAQTFSYVKPVISHFNPTKGPKSGGTKLTITGEHLNAGTDITIKVADTPCGILSNNGRSVVCVTSVKPNGTGNGRLVMKLDGARIPSRKYRYVEDPHVTDVSPRRTILGGGIRITATGKNFDSIQEPKLVVYVYDSDFLGDCKKISDQELICETPNLTGSSLNYAMIDPANPANVTHGFIMDNVVKLRNLVSDSNDLGILIIYPDPVFDRFASNGKQFEGKKGYLHLHGKNLNLVLRESDVTVRVGGAVCNVTSISTNLLTCQLPDGDAAGVGNNPLVVVYIGSTWNQTLGKVDFRGTPIMPLPVVIGIAAGVCVLLVIIIAVCVAYRRKSKERDRVYNMMQKKMDSLEAEVAKECKEAFAELQTDMTELQSDISGTYGIPFRSYHSFCMRVLFPNEELTVKRSLDLYRNRTDNLQAGLAGFDKLIGNKTFLLLFIRTLEQQQQFTMKDKVNVASLISVALQNRMEYHTDILKTLLEDLIEKSVEGVNKSKLLFRRTESVAERMLTNWFTFLLYKFLKECAGEPLYMLFRAIKHQVDKGPVDAYTNEAKYSLSEDKLIRQQLQHKLLTVHIQGSDVHMFQVKVLDCDTITQVKEKILDAIYKSMPYSQRPDKESLDLEWRPGETGSVVLQDEDLTTRPEGEYRKLNTLAHYGVRDQGIMALVPKQPSMFNLSLQSNQSGSRYDGNQYSGNSSLSRSASPHAPIDGTRYHLVKPHEGEHKDNERFNKMVSEVYLTRLLATKGTFQQYVDDLFETIFSTTNRSCALPLAIKYMFDFLDDQALHHGISDPEVVHAWKSNSLPLRFWVNVVKNPDFVFDIYKSNIVDSCLSVVAQTLMDSCSMSPHKLGKDSPSSKLLYAKDIPKYMSWVKRYYHDIKERPAISDQDMNATLAEESRLHPREFDQEDALLQLYEFVVRYNDQLSDNFQDDEFVRNHRLVQKLDEVHRLMGTTEDLRMPSRMTPWTQ